MARSLKYIFKGLPLTLFLSVAGLIFLLAFATASGIGWRKNRTRHGENNCSAPYRRAGDCCDSAHLRVGRHRVVDHSRSRASRASELLGSTIDGTFIILGAAQISDCFCVSLRATLMSGLGECRLLAG